MASVENFVRDSFFVDAVFKDPCLDFIREIDVIDSGRTLLFQCVHVRSHRAFVADSVAAAGTCVGGFGHL